MRRHRSLRIGNRHFARFRVIAVCVPVSDRRKKRNQPAGKRQRCDDKDRDQEAIGVDGHEQGQAAIAFGEELHLALQLARPGIDGRSRQKSHPNVATFGQAGGELVLIGEEPPQVAARQRSGAEYVVGQREQHQRQQERQTNRHEHPQRLVGWRAPRHRLVGMKDEMSSVQDRDREQVQKANGR